MIYRDSHIPQEYNHIAEINDSYVVYVRESTLQNGSTYNAYYQFWEPSFVYLFTNNYKIKTGTNYGLTYNYTSNGMSSYLNSATVNYSLTTLPVDSDLITNNDFDRADMPKIFICQFLCVLIFVFILNQLSKLVKKGGAFFG